MDPMWNDYDNFEVILDKLSLKISSYLMEV